MIRNKIARYRRVGMRLFGKNPTPRVVWRYLVDRQATKRGIRQRKANLPALCRHPGELKLSHVTIYAASNAGDNVLSACVRRLFEQQCGAIDWQLIHLFDPVDDGVISRLNDTKGVIIGGGGLFLPDTNANDQSGWEWACDKRYYPLITAPVFVFAVGYNFFQGQARSQIFEENVNELARRAAFFSLRNRGSIDALRDFVDEDIQNTIVYQPCATMVARCLYPELPPKVTTGNIACNVGLDRIEKRMGDKEETVLTQIAHALKCLSDRGYKVHFIAHCDSDIRFIRYLDREHFKYEYHHATMWEPARVLEFYNGMDMVLGMRGHGLWIPFGMNCHLLALGNQNKTRWFLQDIDAMDWNVDLLEEPETLSERILQKVIEIHEENGEATTQRLLEIQGRLWDVTCRNMALIQRQIQRA